MSDFLEMLEDVGVWLFGRCFVCGKRFPWRGSTVTYWERDVDGRLTGGGTTKHAECQEEES